MNGNLTMYVIEIFNTSREKSRSKTAQTIWDFLFCHTNTWPCHASQGNPNVADARKHMLLFTGLKIGIEGKENDPWGQTQISED